MSISVICRREDAVFYRSLRVEGVNFCFCPPGKIEDSLDLVNSNLAVLDCAFHAEDGIKMMNTLKNMRPEIPVIFVTNVGSEEIVLKAFRNGARDFFVKPFNDNDFRQTILSILSIKRNVKDRRTRFIVAHNEQPDYKVRKQADLSSAIDYIQKNFCEQLSLGVIAEEMNMSKYHFCRTFKRHVGMSPKKFLTYLRMKTAKELMRNDMSISTIAADIGYNDISSFIEQFKKHTGMTPSAYRKTLSRPQ